MDGTYVRYSPSVSGSCSFKQIGNYDSYLVWETMSPGERLCRTVKENCHLVGFGEDNPPAWVVMKSVKFDEDNNVGSDTNGGSLHIAYSNSTGINSTCLGNINGDKWHCYRHEDNRFSGSSYDFHNNARLAHPVIARMESQN